MGKMNNDKGVITWVFTLITLILSVGCIALSWGLFIDGVNGADSLDASSIGFLVWGIIALVTAIYLWWHGILILLGKKENTWVFVIVAFIPTALIGGILMLIAKILN